MTKMVKLLTTGFIVGVWALVPIAPVHANPDITPYWSSTTYNAATMDYTWTYHVTLTNDQGLVANNSPTCYLTIFDFAGYVPGTASYSGLYPGSSWSLSTVNSSGDPSPPLSLADDVNQPNLTWLYTGTVNIPTTTSPDESIDLGYFSVNSIYGKDKEAIAPFKGLASYENKNLTFTNYGLTKVPAVPEGSSLAMLLPSILPIGFIIRRKRTP